MDLSSVGKWLVVFGVALAVVGGALWLAAKTGLPLGRLPGDIRVDRPGFSFSFPLVTCLVVSLALTVGVNLVLWLLRR